MRLDAGARIGRQSLIAGEHQDELVAFERIRAALLESERRPELAEALAVLEWRELVPHLIARLPAERALRRPDFDSN